MPTLPSWQALDFQVIGTWVAGLLTVATLSAAFGESWVSRFAFALFVGAVVGYTAAVTWHAVLWPRVLLLWRDPAGHWPLLLWFALGVLLLARGLSSASWLSNLSLAYLVGVGSALAIGGAVLGTVVPQLMIMAIEPARIGRGSWPAIANVSLVALGTGGVLLRFAYTGRFPKGPLGKAWASLVQAWGGLGHLFILVAFGALFATAVVSLLTVLTARLQFVLFDWLHLLVR